MTVAAKVFAIPSITTPRRSIAVATRSSASALVEAERPRSSQNGSSVTSTASGLEGESRGTIPRAICSIWSEALGQMSSQTPARAAAAGRQASTRS